jgi:putative ABC transport system permease protein
MLSFWGAIRGCGSDLRGAFLALLRARRFTLTATAVLAIGLAASTALFAVVDGIFLRPLPYDPSGRLVTVYAPATHDILRAIRESHVFDATALLSFRQCAVTTRDRGWFTLGASVSAGFFKLLHTSPVIGRPFSAREARGSGRRVALLSYNTWAQHFGASPSIIGRTIAVNGGLRTVVGVLPEGFDFKLESGGLPVGVWFPVGMAIERLKAGGGTRRANRAQSSGVNTVVLFGRRKRGLTLREAQVAFDSAYEQPGGGLPAGASPRPPELMGLKRLRLGSSSTIAWPLFGASCLLLVIVVVNLSALSLVRALERAGQFAIRRALGATRADLIRGALAENATLAAGGGLLALPTTIWLVSLLRTHVPAGALQLLGDIQVDWRVAVFALCALLLASTASGLPPVLLALGLEPSTGQTSGAESPRITLGGRRRARAWRLVLLAECAVAMALLVGSVLMVRSVWLLSRVNLGFHDRDVLQVSLLSTTGYRFSGPAARVLARNETLDERALAASEGTPGIESAGLDDCGWNIAAEVITRRGAGPAGPPFIARTDDVSPGFFKTLGLRLEEGRAFNLGDRLGAPPVIVVNRALQRSFFHGKDPVGRFLTVSWAGKAVRAEVVGVVSDTTWGSLRHGEFPGYYTPLLQTDLAAPKLYVRTREPWRAVAAALRKRFSRTAGKLIVASVTPLSQVIAASSLYLPEFLAGVLSWFAALSLLLVLAGTYAVASSITKRRTREVAIRIALGASRRDIVGSYLRGAAFTAGVGAAAGWGLSLGLSSAIRSWLYGVAPTDPYTLAVAASAVLAVCLLATYVPVRAVLREDPWTKLRYE